MPEPTADPKTVAPVAGRDYTADLAQVRAWFPGDEACLDYLDWLRWPLGFCCPHCGLDTAGRDGPGRYRCHGCWRRVSVTAGTIFDKTRTPMTLWFEAAWLATAGKVGISAAHLQRVLPISSYQTAWTMLAKLRQVMSTSESEPLNGRGEVDETFIGGPRPGKAGRGAAGKTLVAGAIELTTRGWGRARLSVIPNASAESLTTFVTNNIAEGSTVITDGWTAYPPALEGLDLLGVVLVGTGTNSKQVHKVARDHLIADFGTDEVLFPMTNRLAEATAQACRERGLLAHELEQELSKAPKWWEVLRGEAKATNPGPKFASSVAEDLHAVAMEVTRRVAAAESQEVSA